ncbi:AzlC family ABC transporter permease [Halosegnis marinus]|uniref:AzlC family ABC transporter permease n=1 Tax=Halosegnis marinus TaxID=3034023 RepID=A0ABD5ZQU5_9EURY|nr:AzlC family ABC transporter permease [Halosegnis sp. DT85]
MTLRDDFLAGVRDVAPVLLGIVPFGLVAGAAAVEAGLTGAQAVGLSVVVFAGASQLAAIDLLGDGAPLAVVVGTVVVVNLRMVMYSASIAPHFRDLAARWKALVAYLLTDQAYAMSLTRFRENGVSRRGYYLGVAAPLWVVWQICTVVGVVVGARVPAWLPLDFALPLVFLALLVPAVEDAGTAAAALVGGTLATVGAGLPYELGLPLGAVCGVLAGLLAAPVGRALGGVRR